MSEEIIHLSIRAKLPDLLGKSDVEVLPLFREKLGDPTEFYDDDDWHYEATDTIIPIRCSDEWGVQWVLMRDYPYECDPANISFDFLNNIKHKILEKFPTATDFMVCSYTWYSGVDEPVSLTPNFN